MERGQPIFFLSVINMDVDDQCPFCTKRERLFFTVLQDVTVCPHCLCFYCFFWGLHQGGFYLWFSVPRQRKEKSQLLNFVLGQAKMAVYVSRRKKVEGGENISPVCVCVGLIRSRIRLDFSFHKICGDLDSFRNMWCFQSVLCKVEGDGLLIGDVLKI